MERDIHDPEGELHQLNGKSIQGTEMGLLEGVAAILSLGFPRGVVHAEGHGLGFEHWASLYGLPVLTLTAMPLLLREAVEYKMIDDVRSVVVSGDVGGVMMANMVSELMEVMGVEVETIYGEKRSDEMFTPFGRDLIKGAQVVLPDDIMSSGKTVFEKVGGRDKWYLR